MIRKNKTAKGGGIGYIIVGSLAIMAVLFCIMVITGSIAPLVLKVHAGDAPAMMTMPIFVYCLLADFILLEAVFLCFMPGIRKHIDGEQQAAPGKKKLPLSVIVTIVCCALLLCSIILAPNVCNVMTEQGLDTYVFFKTGSYAWEDIPLYELTFSQQNGLELSLYLTKDKHVPMFGAVNSINNAFTEKYGSVYGFACYLKQMAIENDLNFRVENRESIAHYFKDSVYWEHIEKLIQ
ncbi:MAG: hypothetical protein IIW17_01840 [Clostridia bacterium]|nr:hypothetical protein [Clostridia bacterium]MBQ5792737.1 hypothetical protein [Clostridia bacterium]